MKKQSRFTVIPNTFWATPDLSIEAKWVAISIDSFCESSKGASVGVTALSTDTNLTAKQVRESLKELQSKGALDVNIGEDGEKLLKVYLYKERYFNRGEKVVIGDKPNDTAPLPYDEIVQTWNECCTTLPKVTRLTPSRKQKIRTVLKAAECSADDFLKAIRLVGSSAFLNGSKGSWSCSFDWVIKSASNITKILEGNYHKDYNERREYESIMNGSAVNQRGSHTDDFYK